MDKNNVVHVYSGIYSAIRKNEIMPFAATRIVAVQSLSRVRLSATPWTAAHEASLSITNSRSLLKLMSIESVMPSNHLILCLSLLFCSQSPPATWMDLEIIILSEVSQKEKDKYHISTIWHHLHVESKIWHEHIYETDTDPQVKRTDLGLSGWGGESWEGEWLGVWC